MLEKLASLIGALLLPELRLLRQACEGIQAALEYHNAQEWGMTLQGDPALPAVEVTYVNDLHQAEMMDIELRLTQASGTPPTEEDMMVEWERRHADEVEAPQA